MRKLLGVGSVARPLVRLWSRPQCLPAPGESGCAVHLDKLVEAIEKRLGDDWHRDRQLEENASVGGVPRYYCFCCSAQDRRPAAALFLCQATGQDSLEFANVVPTETEKEQLSPDECNTVTVDFYMQFVRPCCEELGLVCEMTDAYIGEGEG